MSEDSGTLLTLHETMVRIRVFEQRAEQLFLEKKIPGFIHLYVGEEAIAAGIITQLRDDDYLTSTHRGHGHMLAKGADSKRMMAELFGKATGYCKGKGGSMHIMDFSLGVLGANGEVAGGIPIAAGAGMAIRLVKKTDQVVACFFGDGASNRGAFHEGLNWAAIYRLPIVFVVENNCYASTMPTTESTPVKDISIRAQGYNMEGPERGRQRRPAGVPSRAHGDSEGAPRRRADAHRGQDLPPQGTLRGRSAEVPRSTGGRDAMAG